MSGQSSRKKRFGSRRTVRSRHETAEGDELHVTDASVAQQHIAEETTEPKSALSDPDDSKLEIKQPASPEVPMSRRKLGSSRKLKGRQHVKESETEACLEPREEVEAITWGKKNQEAAQLFVTDQRERQEEAYQFVEQDISSAATTDHNSELEIHSAAIGPEELKEALISKSEHKLAEFEETNNVQSEDIKENLHDVEPSEATSVSSPSVNKEFNNQPFNSRDRADDLSPEMKTSQSDHFTELTVNRVVSESNTPKLTTGDNSPSEIVEVEHIARQVMISSPEEDFPSNRRESEPLNFSGAPNVVTEVYDGTLGPTPTQDTHQSDFSPHSRIPDASNNPNIEFSKQRQHFEESKEEVSGNTKDDEMPKIVTLPLTTEVTHEDLQGGGEHDHLVSEPNNSSVISVTALGYFHEVRDSLVTDDPRTDPESLLPESESSQEEKDEEETDFKVDVSDESVGDAMEGSDESHTHSEDVVKTDVEEDDESTQSAEVIDRFYSCESLLDDAEDADSEIVSVNLTNQTERTSTQFDVVVKSAIESAADEQDSNPDCRLDQDHIELGQEYEVKSEDVKHNTDLTVHQDKQDVVSVTNYPGTDSESVITNSEEAQGKKKTSTEVDVSDKPENDCVEESDESDALLREAGGAHHSEDSVNIDQTVETTQIKQKTQMHHTSEDVSHDAAESSDSAIIYGNLTDQAGIPNTSDWSVKNTEDLTTQWQNLIPDSNPDDKQDEKHTKKKEDSFVDDSKLQWMGSTEQGDADENFKEVKHSTEQTVDPDRVYTDISNSHFSSEPSASQQLDSFDSQHQEYSPSGDEQTETGFNPLTNRRKLGSSRRNKRKQQVRESEVENTNNPDTPEIMTASSTESKQEELVERSNFGMTFPVISFSQPESSSEALNSSVSNNQEADLESLISQNPHAPFDELVSGFKVGEFNEADSTTLEELDQSDSPENEEVRAAHNSKDDGKEQTQTEEILQLYPPSESVSEDATDTQGLNEAEITTTHQAELVEGNTSGLNPDHSQSEHGRDEVNLEASEQRNDNYSHSEKPEVSEVEKPEMTQDLVDTLKGGAEEIGHLEKKELFSETEEKKSSLQNFPAETPVDSHPLDHPEGREEEEAEERGFRQGGSRRKLASSRRHKGRQRGKDSVTDSYSEPTEKANGKTAETSETTASLSTIKTTGLEASVETVLKATDKSDSSQTEREKVRFVPTTELTAGGGNSDPAEEQQVINQSQSSQMLRDEPIKDAGDKEKDKFTQVLQQDVQLKSYSGNEPHVCKMAAEISTENKSPEELIVAEQSVAFETDLSGRDSPMKEEQLLDAEGSQHSEDEPEVMPAQLQDLAQDFSGCLISQDGTSSTSQSELAVKSDGDFLTREPDYNLDTQQDPLKQDNFENSEQRNKDTHDTEESQTTATERIHTAQGDMVSKAEETLYQENKGHFTETEDSDSSPQSLQCEMLPALNSQHQQNDTTLGPGGNRQKLGSSQEKSVETMLEGLDEADSSPTEHVKVEAKQKAHFGSDVPISEFIDLTADRQPIKSDPSEKPDEGSLTVSSASEIKKTDGDVETTGHLHWDNVTAYLDSECEAFSMTAEVYSGRDSPRKHEVERNVEQETFSSEQQKMSKNGEHVEHSVSSVSAAQQVDVNNTDEEQTEAARMQEIQKISQILDVDHECLLQTTEPNSALESNNDEDQADIKPAVNRRKLGSSRRHKRRQLVEDDVTEAQPESNRDTVENTEGDKKPQTMSQTTEAATQEDSNGLKTAEDENKLRSTENSKKLTEEGSNFTQFVFNNSASISSSNNTDSDEKDKKPAKEAEDLGGFIGSDTVQQNYMQLTEASNRRDDSDYMQNISSHDDNTSCRSEIEDVLDLKGASHGQNTDVCSLDKDSLRQEIYVQQTADAKETVDFVGITERSVDVPGLEQDENDAALETNTLAESVAQVQTVDVSDNETEVSAAMDASNNSESEQNNSGWSENLGVKSKQKRRKLGSTRRSNRKPKEEAVKDGTPESDFDTYAEVRNLDKLEVVEEFLSAQSETAPPLSYTVNKDAHEQEHELESSGPDPQTSDGNVIQDINNLMSLQFELSASHNVEVVNPAAPFSAADVSESERNMNVTMQPSQTDNFAKTEVQDTSGRHSESPPNTENNGNSGFVSFIEKMQDIHNEEKPESAEETQDANKHRPNNDDEESQSRALQIRSSTNKRRKMGSTRRNLGSQTKRADLHQTQEEDNEATESETPVTEVTVESVPELEVQQQLHTEDKNSGSERNKEKVFETIERTHVGESQFKPPVQQTVSQQQPEPEETEHQVSLSELSSTSGTTSEVAPRGRRRKMGSHRKSRGPQSQKDYSARTDPENERRVIDVTEEVEEHREEAASRDEPSQIDASDKEPSSSISEPLKDVSEKNPVHPRHAEVAPTRGSPTHFSLAGNPGGGDRRSNGYNVVMIGDTSVGKTSFMRRAQSGKFFFDTPASVGLDSCMWTVMVEGKPVVLHVWDTAGQERFRSITRQIFHRAQAFLLMYDVSSPQSFSAVSYWATCIQESAPEDVIVFLLGNKSDSADRKVKTQQGEILATEYKFGFMECSAATGENVIQSLETVARLLTQRANPRNEATVLHKNPEQRKGSGCC